MVVKGFRIRTSGSQLSLVVSYLLMLACRVLALLSSSSSLSDVYIRQSLGRRVSQIFLSPFWHRLKWWDGGFFARVLKGLQNLNGWAQMSLGISNPVNFASRVLALIKRSGDLIFFKIRESL